MKNFPDESSASGDIELDAIDRKILAAVQVDALIRNQELADRIGLSPPACLKRVRRLRARGVIRRSVALVDPAAVGYPVLVLTRVKLERQSKEAIAAFEQAMRQLPQVAQCFVVAGDTDFILTVRARSVQEYQAFTRRVLTIDLGVRGYSSDIVLEVVKNETNVPV